MPELNAKTKVSAYREKTVNIVDSGHDRLNQRYLLTIRVSKARVTARRVRSMVLLAQIGAGAWQFSALLCSLRPKQSPSCSFCVACCTFFRSGLDVGL